MSWPSGHIAGSMIAYGKLQKSKNHALGSLGELFSGCHCFEAVVKTVLMGCAYP